MVGLPKSIIKKYGISKKAWAIYRGLKKGGYSKRLEGVVSKRLAGRLTGRKRKAYKPKRTTYVRRKTYMAKRKRSRSRSFLSFGTLTKFVKIGALVAPAATRFMGGGAMEDKIKMTVQAYTGFNMYNNTFNFAALAEGWMPYVATSLITTGISKINGIIKKL